MTVCSVTIYQESRKHTRRQHGREPAGYLEFILLVLCAFVEWPVIAELPDVIYFVEALDVVRNPLSLQYFLALWNGSHSIDLQI